MHNRFRNIGAPPGTIQYHGPQASGAIKITLIQFNEHEFFEKEFYDLSECVEKIDDDKIKWINVEGVHDVAIVETIGKMYNIHSLTLEDIVHVDQRPKYEDYDHYILAIMKMINYSDKVHAEQLAMILVNNTVISF